MDTPETQVTIVRVFGKHEAAKHYGVSVDDENQPYHYRLLCSGQVIDAMVHGGALEYPTCLSCQHLDDPMDVETACWKIAQALGYRGNGGGWIYRSATAKRAICQGWGNFATLKRSGFAAAGMLVRNANGDGYYVDMAAVADVARELTGVQVA